jgi:hypothetical protein
MPHASSGSSLYTAKEIADRALRKIRAFSEENDLKETLYWLDMMLAHYAAKRPYLALMRDELEVTLVEDDGSYTLREELNASLPTGTQYPVEAMLQDANGNRRPLNIITHREWRRIEVPSRTGTPDRVYIDRLNNPVMRVYPIPGENEDGWKIILTVQTFSPTVRPRNVNRDTALTNQPTGLRVGWQLWGVTQLACIIGNGPVRALPLDRIKDFRGEAMLFESELMAYENREHDNNSPHQQPSVYQ